MSFISIRFKDDKCFKAEWAGFENLKTINVLIGKNNSGKSYFLNFIRSACARKLRKAPDHDFYCEGLLKADFLLQTLNVTHLGSDWWCHEDPSFAGLRFRYIYENKEYSFEIVRDFPLPRFYQFSPLPKEKVNRI